LNYWIFKVNPDQYRLEARLQAPDPQLTWAVTRYHDRIQSGDTVFIWRAGTPRGICAVMVIDVCPYEPEPQDLNDGFEISLGSVTRGSEHWAKGHLVQRFPIIEASVIKKIPGLELFSFFSAFQQAINFSVTRPEGAILLEFIEKHQAEVRENVSKLTLKSKKPEAPRATSVKKKKPAGPTSGSSEFALLQCETCGRYVVNSDKERHIRETHAGQPVDWKTIK
jgi:hypothetical protein